MKGFYALAVGVPTQMILSLPAGMICEGISEKVVTWGPAGKLFLRERGRKGKVGTTRSVVNNYLEVDGKPGGELFG